MCFYYLAAAPTGALWERAQHACYDYGATRPENEPVFFFCFVLVKLRPYAKLQEIYHVSTVSPERLHNR